MADVTRILSAIDAGDPHAAEQLLPLVYDELRKLAAAKMAHERPDHTLDATALVHEAYVRLVRAGSVSDGERFSVAHASSSDQYANRRHFFAAAAEAMRRILIENARRRNRERHGGGMHRVALDSEVASPARDERLLALDEALVRFNEIEPQKAELLKLRSFAGLSLDQAAEALGISPSTADRWWAYARAWLRVEISGEKPD